MRDIKKEAGFLTNKETCFFFMSMIFAIRAATCSFINIHNMNSFIVIKKPPRRGDLKLTVFPYGERLSDKIPHKLS